ncbi:MAG TPA: WYL domain-containing protein [Anaerolineae bacterium]|nr:WYL domain-containing protein [Anaerolineae bacterium]
MPGCLWTVCASEPAEAQPWIRSWGVELEVLSPPALWQALPEEAARMANVPDERNAPLPAPGHWTHCGRVATAARPQCSCVALLEYEGIGRARLRDNLFG